MLCCALVVGKEVQPWKDATTCVQVFVFCRMLPDAVHVCWNNSLWHVCAEGLELGEWTTTCDVAQPHGWRNVLAVQWQCHCVWVVWQNGQVVGLQLLLVTDCVHSRALFTVLCNTGIFCQEKSGSLSCRRVHVECSDVTETNKTPRRHLVGLLIVNRVGENDKSLKLKISYAYL